MDRKQDYHQEYFIPTTRLSHTCNVIHLKYEHISARATLRGHGSHEHVPRPSQPPLLKALEASKSEFKAG